MRQAIFTAVAMTLLWPMAGAADSSGYTGPIASKFKEGGSEWTVRKSKHKQDKCFVHENAGPSPWRFGACPFNVLIDREDGQGKVQFRTDVPCHPDMQCPLVDGDPLRAEKNKKNRKWPRCKVGWTPLELHAARKRAKAAGENWEQAERDSIYKIGDTKTYAKCDLDVEKEEEGTTKRKQTEELQPGEEGESSKRQRITEPAPAPDAVDDGGA